MPSILLVDLASNEEHSLDTSQCILGRNWLMCDDKRISRSHGILKILSKTQIAVQATHQNPIFFRKKADTQINQIQQNEEVQLSIGDSFGLLVDKFWFRMQACDQTSADANCANPQLQMNGSTIKRRAGSDSEPDSTNKKVKTEPDEFQSSGDTTLVTSNGDDGSGNASNTTTENVANHESLPSTSGASANNPTENQNAMCPLHEQIKTEPIDSDENEAQSMQTEGEIVVKVEPDIQHNCNDCSDCSHCSQNVPIKTEVKQEPTDNGDSVATSSNESVAPSENNQVTAPSNSRTVDGQQTNRPALRECCRYGVRCYRRNPTHRSEQAHPGDADYRLPDYPDPPLGTPRCPFLDRCYRRNPLHFQQFSHKTNLQDKKKDGFEATAKEPKRKTNTPNYANQPNGDDDDEEEDPFASDGDSDPDFNGDTTPESDDRDVYDAETDEESQQHGGN